MNEPRRSEFYTITLSAAVTPEVFRALLALPSTFPATLTTQGTDYPLLLTLIGGDAESHVVTETPEREAT